MATASTAPRVFEPAEDPAPQAGPPGPLFWRRIPEVLATEPEVGPMDLWVFYQFLCAIGPRDFSGSIPQRELAERARVSERTVRSSIAKLARLGFLAVERERVGEVNVIRLGFDYRAILVLQPEAPTATGSGGRKRRAQRQPVAAIQPGEQRQQAAAGQRQQAAAAPYSLRESRERTTTTSLLDPAGDGAGDVATGSSSFSLPSEEGTPPEGPTEAPGSPQCDRREESAESPDPLASAPPWAVQAIGAIAAAWPDAPLESREAWRRKLGSRWREIGRGADGEPPRWSECGAVAALALEYAALARDRLKNPDDPTGYLAPALANWASAGFTSAEIEAEVRSRRPKPAPAEAAAVEDRPRREKPPEEVRKAGAEYLRALVRNDPAAEELGRRHRELELAWEARKKDRPEGVSACPPAGSEL